jgi:chromate transporter
METTQGRADSPKRTTPAVHVGLKDLFFAFLKIGLLGFGGVAPMAHHVIVEDRAWFSEEEYAALFGVSQVLPGGNIINAAAMIGDRFRGGIGAIVATAGLMLMPLAILMTLATLYDHFSQLPAVHAAIGGSASAAAGLIIGMAVKMMRRIELSPEAVLFVLLAFCSVGLMRWSLIATVVALAPVSIGAAFLRRRA